MWWSDTWCWPCDCLTDSMFLSWNVFHHLVVRHLLSILWLSYWVILPSLECSTPCDGQTLCVDLVNVLLTQWSYTEMFYTMWWSDTWCPSCVCLTDSTILHWNVVHHVVVRHLVSTLWLSYWLIVPSLECSTPCGGQTLGVNLVTVLLTQRSFTELFYTMWWSDTWCQPCDCLTDSTFLHWIVLHHVVVRHLLSILWLSYWVILPSLECSTPCDGQTLCVDLVNVLLTQRSYTEMFYTMWWSDTWYPSCVCLTDSTILHWNVLHHVVVRHLVSTLWLSYWLNVPSLKCSTPCGGQTLGVDLVTVLLTQRSYTEMFYTIWWSDTWCRPCDCLTDSMFLHWNVLHHVMVRHLVSILWLSYWLSDPTLKFSTPFGGQTLGVHLVTVLLTQRSYTGMFYTVWWSDTWCPSCDCLTDSTILHWNVLHHLVVRHLVSILWLSSWLNDPTLKCSPPCDGQTLSVDLVTVLLTQCSFTGMFYTMWWSDTWCWPCVCFTDSTILHWNVLHHVVVRHLVLTLWLSYWLNVPIRKCSSPFGGQTLRVHLVTVLLSHPSFTGMFYTMRWSDTWCWPCDCLTDSMFLSWNVLHHLVVRHLVSILWLSYWVIVPSLKCSTPCDGQTLGVHLVTVLLTQWSYTEMFYTIWWSDTWCWPCECLIDSTFLHCNVLHHVVVRYLVLTLWLSYWLNNPSLKCSTPCDCQTLGVHLVTVLLTQRSYTEMFYTMWWSDTWCRPCDCLTDSTFLHLNVLHHVAVRYLVLIL